MNLTLLHSCFALLFLAPSNASKPPETEYTGTQLQSCHITEPERGSDLCFALASAKNGDTHQNDLSIHLSAKFEEQRGWAAIGIGEGMAGALMFVMYPGEMEGSVILSVRTTGDHTPPTVAQQAPKIRVTNTWHDARGYLNARIMCFGCESWIGNQLSIESCSQPWIWAANSQQKTGSDDKNLPLDRHTKHGVAYLDMRISYSETEYNPHGMQQPLAQLSADRISTPLHTDINPQPHHKHSILGLVAIHGLLLSAGFLSLSIGVLAIRSGMIKAFKAHWIIQTSAGCAIVLGCLIGIKLTFSHGGHFDTIHQLLGLVILPSMIAQGLFGYYHHMNYVKYGRRTSISYYHIWIGRVALIAGNVNIGFGMNLAHSSSWKYFLWYASLALQILLLLPMWYVWCRGRTILDVVRRIEVMKDKRAHQSIEQEAFMIGDSDEEEEGDKRDDLELESK